jgi:glycine betaine/proline transport system permease protein
MLKQYMTMTLMVGSLLMPLFPAQAASPTAAAVTAEKSPHTTEIDPWGATMTGTAQPDTDDQDELEQEQTQNSSSDPWSAASTAGTTLDETSKTDPEPISDASSWLTEAAKTGVKTPFDWLSPFKTATLPLDQWVTEGIDGLVAHYRGAFQLIRMPVDFTLDHIDSALNAVPATLMIALLTLLSWQAVSGTMAIGTFVSLLLIGLIGAWPEAMTTLALVITSLIFCMIIGLPSGIFLARHPRIAAWIRPLLDAMQTTPAFVYLVPVVMLFGIGNVPGVVVTIIFALPPVIRLTTLGIQQVPEDLIEAAHSFGASPRQLLFKVQLPLAMPTIMAGVNQTLMLSLSMVVIASMIAVGGLGQMVLRGIGRLDIGTAAVGGVGIVLLAIILDRFTQALGKKERTRARWYQRGLVGLFYPSPPHA